MASTQLWSAAHTARGLACFSDDAELQFLAGCLHEMVAAPRTQATLARGSLPVGGTVRVGSPQSELGDAASSLKRALEVNPGHAEARLHYGRVLTLTGRNANAVTELRRAVTELRDPVQQYYGQLFLGAALETTNQTEAARTAYQAAAALFPRAQAPLLGLSQLAASAGDREVAIAAMAPLLALPASEDDRPDPYPWWNYFLYCGRQGPDLLAEARLRLATPRRGEGR